MRGRIPQRQTASAPRSYLGASGCGVAADEHLHGLESATALTDSLPWRHRRCVLADGTLQGYHRTTIESPQCALQCDLEKRRDLESDHRRPGLDSKLAAAGCGFTYWRNH